MMIWWINHTNKKWKPIKEEDIFEYPLYFKSLENDAVVEFTGLQTGTVIKTINGDVGEFSDMWMEHTNDSHWKPIKEEDIFEYPLYFKSLENGLIVKFDGFESGIVFNIGDSSYNMDECSDSWVEHYNSDIWTIVDPFELQHKDLVECWDNDWIAIRHLRFYDKINNSTFWADGTSNENLKFDNYKKIERCNEPEWAKEARKLLR